MSKKNIRILLIEDSEDDINFFRLVLKQCDPELQLDVARDGDEATQYFAIVAHSPATLPDLVLLDMMLPKKTGLELLQDLKNDEVRKRIPIIAITASQSITNIREAYAHGAACCLTKPERLADFSDLIQKMFAFWSRCQYS